MKKYTQTGTFIIVIFGFFLIIIGAMIFKTEIFEKSEFIILCLTWVLFFIVLLGFYKLTIIVDDDSVSFLFGMGWFGKSYQFSEIDSCEVVKNPILAGIGIRWLGNGWLYNVSGFKAIELRFKNKKSIVRIGTDKPEEIAAAIQKKLGE